MSVCACEECECWAAAPDGEACLGCKHGQHVADEE